MVKSKNDNIKKDINQPKSINKKSQLQNDFIYKLEPIKLIYKYKNNNQKNQYLTYIYVGSLGKRFESILKKIEKLSLYDTLITLDECT